MNVLVNNLFLMLHFQHFLLFKIEIKQCIIASRDGFCRPETACVGFYEALRSPSCLHGEVCCPQRTISEKKCYEYAAAVYDIYDTGYLMGISEELTLEDNCGISTAIPLIIGGEKAQPKEFPHMAAIGYGKNIENAKWMCGGSLISETYILTAAHCLQSYLGNPRFIKLGVINVANNNEDDKNIQIFEIRDAISHPSYRPSSQWSDIALLRLNREVVFTAYVRPACLDYSGVWKDTTVLATGWGVLESARHQALHWERRESFWNITSDMQSIGEGIVQRKRRSQYGSKEGSPDLMKVELDITEKSVCNKIYKRALKEQVNDSLLCAGFMEGGKDACQGDSGGPLQAVKTEPYCMYSIVGVTSFGSFCGMVPSIYSRVFYYIPWIESVVWPNHL